MKYVLEIYPPRGSGHDVLHSLKSTSPFMAFNKGDIINPNLFSEYATAELKSIREQFPEKYPHGVALRITGVEHMIWDTEDSITHKICLFTESVDNVAASRVS